MKYKNFKNLLDDYLKDEERAAAFLAQSLDEEDIETFLLTIKDVIRVHGGISKIAKKAKLNRASIYSLFSESANPELRTLMSVLSAIGYELKVARKPEAVA